MDPFHEQLARTALDAAGSFGFALAGGYAVQAHGFLNRLSSDVDLFAEASADFDFTQAVDVVIAAYLREGLRFETDLRVPKTGRRQATRRHESPKSARVLPPGRAGARASSPLRHRMPPALGAIPVVGAAAQGVAENIVRLRAERPLQTSFDHLADQLRELDLRVLVVLDDVDRLQPDELLVLFKAIRLLARFPGVYYLLA